MIGIVDYNAGNITSVERALKSLGIDFVLSKKPEELENCEKLILFHESYGAGDEFANPRTDVHKIVRMLMHSTE